jgi:hypothetical protein
MFEFVICGDFNVNFLNDSSLKLQLSLLFQSYNMYSIIDFPTRTTNCSSTTVDNIFIDYHRINSFDVLPVCNGLSDHDVQCLSLYNFFSASLMGSKPLIRKIIIINQAMAL